MNPFSNIGKRVYDLRMREGWTQSELAQKVNATCYQPDVKQPHIAGIERSQGDKLPSVPLLFALAEVFGVTPEELAGVEMAPTAPLLTGLRVEDRAMVVALVTRLRRDNEDTLDEDWELLNTAALDLGRGAPVGNRMTARG